MDGINGLSGKRSIGKMSFLCFHGLLLSKKRCFSSWMNEFRIFYGLNLHFKK